MHDSIGVLGSIGWLAPGWAWALPVALGVPLLAHWLHRRAGPTLRFPATRFVQQAQRETGRFQRPRHIALLVLRMAALAAIVLAFMQPVWRAQANAGGSFSNGWDLTVILDRSASMRRTQAGMSLFARARAQAEDLIKRLDPGRDRATVILADHDPTTLLPEPTANFQALRARLARTGCTFERAQLDSALALASARAQSRRQANPGGKRSLRQPRLEIFSDRQATTWPASKIADLRQASIPVGVHPIGEAASNLAIFSPTISPTRPVVGTPNRVTATVANFSAQPQAISVQLHTQGAGQARRWQKASPPKGGRQGQTIVRLGPFERTTVQMPLEFKRSGRHQVVLTIEPRGQMQDGLPIDNRTGLIVRVVESRAVTLITRADPDDPSTAAYYLSRALSPRRTGSKVSVTVAGPGLLGRFASADHLAWDPPSVDASADGLVLVEAGGLTMRQVRGLRRWLTRGSSAGRVGGPSGVLWFVDSPEAVTAVERFDRSGEGPETGAGVDGGNSPLIPAGGEPWSMAENLGLEMPGRGHRGSKSRLVRDFLQPFRGPTRAPLADQRFSAVMAGDLSSEAVALLNFDTGRPALALTRFGADRLAMIAAAIDPRQSPLVKGPLFVTLIHQLLRVLIGYENPAQPRPHPGQPLGPSPSQSKAQTWLGPAGRRHPDRLVDSPGAYWALDRDDHLVDGVWAGLDPAESNLRTAKLSPVNATRPSVPDKAASASTASSESTESTASISKENLPSAIGPPRLDLWPYTLLISLLLLGLESLLAHGIIDLPVLLRHAAQR